MRGFWMFFLLALAGWAVPGPWAATAALTPSERSACLNAHGAEAVRACSPALNKAPADSDLRMALADALIELQDYRRAVNVLRQGLELEPGNASIKSRLDKSESLLQEKLWIERKDKQRHTSGTSGLNSEQRVAASRYEIRCTRLEGIQALEACNEGLASFPGNAKLYGGKGDALMALQRYGEAMEAYGDALILTPGRKEIQRQLNKARTLRRVSAKKCLQLSGQTALEACAAALAGGADDEAAIRSRQGDLLSAAGRRRAAVAAYQSALAVAGSDSTLEAKLAALGHPVKQPRPQQPVEQTLPAPPKPKKTSQETAALNKPAPPSPAPSRKAAPVPPVSNPAPGPPTVNPPAPPLQKQGPIDRTPAPTLYSNAPTAPGMTH